VRAPIKYILNQSQGKLLPFLLKHQKVYVLLGFTATTVHNENKRFPSSYSTWEQPKSLGGKLTRSTLLLCFCDSGYLVGKAPKLVHQTDELHGV